MKPKILTTLKTYTLEEFWADLLAGITVAMVAIPLSLAIAIASAAPPEKGIITAIIGGFLISLLGGSRVQIGGPTGAFIVVVFGIIATHGYDGLVLATLMAGIILLICGLLRIGSLIRYVPEAVINGFTIGIAIIIATSQLKDLFGLTIQNQPADFLEKIPSLWNAHSTLNLYALSIGIATIALIAIFRKLSPKIPGLIIAVAITSCSVLFLPHSIDTISSRFGAFPNQFPMPSMPEISTLHIIELLPSAFVIAFLAGVESLLSAMVADRMSGGKHRPNAEILAQGAANIGSALFAGLPATGAIARTATNIKAGGKTPIAGLVHAAVILLAMLFAAPLAGYLAMPALAGLLILTAWHMSEPHKWKEYMSAPIADRLLLLLTLVLTVIADLTVAISVGIVLGLLLRWKQRHAPPPDWQPPQR